jgi:hypothetical protein
MLLRGALAPVKFGCGYSLELPAEEQPACA